MVFIILQTYLEFNERDKSGVTVVPANKKSGAEEETEPVRVSAPGNNETLVPILSQRQQGSYF